ncbi:MAG: SLATT domain-containing protein, partial [Betaproteobacteria bacterium]
RTVDQAHVVIAVWDGKPTAGLGGTGDVVGYARALAKPLFWLNPTDAAIVKERLEELPKNPGPFWPQPDPRAIVERHFHELDEAATRSAPTVRHFIQRLVLLHLAAAVAGLTTLALDLHGVLEYGASVLEIAVLGVAFSLIASRHHGHMAWMKTRIEAEICRSFLATWPMRARLDPFPRIVSNDYRRLTRSLRLIQLLDTTPAPTLEAACRDYQESRVRNQIAYYSRGGEQARRAYHQLRLLAMISTAIAAVLAAAHVVLSLQHVTGAALTITELLSLVLPLVSAALLALILTQEHSRRAMRYAEMVTTLEAAGRELKAVRTWNGLARIAVDIEEALLNEAVEWQSFRRFATEPH